MISPTKAAKHPPQYPPRYAIITRNQQISVHTGRSFNFPSSTHSHRHSPTPLPSLSWNQFHMTKAQRAVHLKCQPITGRESNADGPGVSFLESVASRWQPTSPPQCPLAMISSLIFRHSRYVTLHDVALKTAHGAVPATGDILLSRPATMGT